MISELLVKKSLGQALSWGDYYEIVDYILKYGTDKNACEMFLALNAFGMTKYEVLYLAHALRDSGKILNYKDCIFEKHSTGGIGDSTSVVLIPLLASLGYKMIKTSGKSLVYTNGSSDRFKSIPDFSVKLSDNAINRALLKTNACVLSHNGDMCPADRIMYDLIENLNLDKDINLLAASIVCKKLASGARVVLVDVKFGEASVVKDYHTAIKLSKLLKFLFNESHVKSVIVITNTVQTLGEGIGNAIEVVDALKVLQGRNCVLREVATEYAALMIMVQDKKVKRKEIISKIDQALNSGAAYDRFMEIINVQGGDSEVVKNGKLFVPYKSVNFTAQTDGYVGVINSLILGELTRRLCKNNHDNNIGVAVYVKVGDYVKKGDIIISFYYKDDEDLQKYKNAIAGSVRITSQKIKKLKMIQKVIK